MSVSAISSANPVMYQPAEPPSSKGQQAKTDALTMEHALESGNVTVAKQAFDALTAMHPKGSAADVFQNPQIQRGLEGLGQQLQNGNLAGARSSLHALSQAFQSQTPAPPTGSDSESGLDVQG